MVLLFQVDEGGGGVYCLEEAFETIYFTEKCYQISGIAPYLVKCYVYFLLYGFGMFVFSDKYGFQLK